MCIKERNLGLLRTRVVFGVFYTMKLGQTYCKGRLALSLKGKMVKCLDQKSEGTLDSSVHSANWSI